MRFIDRGLSVKNEDEIREFIFDYVNCKLGSCSWTKERVAFEVIMQSNIDFNALNDCSIDNTKVIISKILDTADSLLDVFKGVDN